MHVLNSSDISRDVSFSPILLGTCGWAYGKEWKSIFYPDFLSPNRYLEYYSQIFPTVEIDTSFYHTPKQSSVQKWVEQTPDNFQFAVKLPQEVTHTHKLDIDTCDQALRFHFQNFSPLEQSGKSLGHLIQLPPRFSMEKHWDRLESFINHWQDWRETQGRDLLGSAYNLHSWRPIIEFRNRSWMQERTFALLRAYDVTFCAVVEPILPPDFIITTPDFFYLRFHGYGKKPFWKYNFSDKELSQWAKKLLEFKKTNKNTKIVAFFNNHFSGYAVKNAMDILPKLNQSPKMNIDELNAKMERKMELSKKMTPKLKEEQKKHKSLDVWFKKQQ